MDKTPKGPINLLTTSHASSTSVGSKFHTHEVPEGKFVFVPSLHEDIKLEQPPNASVSMLQNASSRSTASSLPKRLDLNPTKSQVYRFRTSSSITSGENITVANLIGVVGGVCTVANSKIALVASSIRLRRVTVWPPASTSAATAVALDWSAGQSSQIMDDGFDRSLPQGITMTGALVFIPPEKTLASFWITSTDAAATMFNIYAPQGAIIDLAIDYKLCLSLSPILATVAAGTLGNYYYLAMDGPAANKIVPTSALVPTTS